MPGMKRSNGGNGGNGGDSGDRAERKEPVLHIATYNIHKGFSHFNRRVVIHELRERLRHLNPDIVFLQEVQGLHQHHADRHANWPEAPQHEFLAADVWNTVAYGRNAIYDHGHHGNAILSRFTLLDVYNQDVTHLRFERRGLLHCRLILPAVEGGEEGGGEREEAGKNGAGHRGSATVVHCVCVHLSLFARSRRQQMEALAGYVEQFVPTGAPLIIAGDFNDWRNHADTLLARRLGLTEVFGIPHARERPVRSFPAGLPLLRLDRIYVRGFSVSGATVHHGGPWARISDHAALSARLVPCGASFSASSSTPASIASVRPERQSRMRRGISRLAGARALFDKMNGNGKAR